MGTSFNRIAYEALEIGNGVALAAVDAALGRTGLPAGARAVDVGTGAASVAIRMAEGFGFTVTAIEFDPAMAGLARERIDASGAADRIELIVGSAADVLIETPPVDLVAALGTTDVNGDRRPAPAAAFAWLIERLVPGGWLLWGDLVWLAAPPEPLRQVVEAANLYADDAGWKAAAAGAGFQAVWAEISPQRVFDAYAAGADRAARDWLAANPAAPEAASVRASAGRVKAMFEAGRPFMGFGLYLLRKPV